MKTRYIKLFVHFWQRKLAEISVTVWRTKASKHEEKNQFRITTENVSEMWVMHIQTQKTNLSFVMKNENSRSLLQTNFFLQKM